MTLHVGHVARPLYDAVGPEAFSAVAAWLAEVAAEHALETGHGASNKIHSPSVSWLAEAVAFFDPDGPL